MNQTIGVVAALPGEARALVGHSPWEKSEKFPYCRKALKDGIDLVVVQSGMGVVNAFPAASWLFEKGVAALGCFGVSGGLDPRLGIGDLVFADAVYEERDGGTSLVWKERQCHSELIFSSLAGEQTIRRGSIITVSQAVLNASDKQALFDRTGTVAVDMETAAVARAAGRFGLPFFAIRTICDPAHVSVPESLLQCVDEKGRPRFSDLFSLIIRNPLIIPHLLRMKRDFSAALSSTPHVLHFLSEMHTPAP